MTSVVVDTHTIIWFLAQSARLLNSARQAIRDAITANNPVYVSAISIIEVLYPVEKGRFTQDVLDDLRDVLPGCSPTTRLGNSNRIPGSGGCGKPAPFVLSRNDVPDRPDRIIEATALQMGLPLVTADSKLQPAGITTIW